MTILLPALAVAFAALCVWLAVRTVNRRERWAKWMLAGIVGLPVLYVLSFGPACWWFSTPTDEWHGKVPAAIPMTNAPRLYWPIGWLIVHGHPAISRPMYRYALLNTHGVAIPTGLRADDWIVAIKPYG